MVQIQKPCVQKLRLRDIYFELTMASLSQGERFAQVALTGRGDFDYALEELRRVHELVEWAWSNLRHHCDDHGC